MTKITVESFSTGAKAREWDQYVIGVFDPEFNDGLKFFDRWNDEIPNVIEALFKPHADYDLVSRFSKVDAEYEMPLIQACVGPDVFVYLLPIVPENE